MASHKSFSVKYDKRAEKLLDKLDPHTRLLILSWVNKNLEGCSNPRALGKSLKGDHSGKWRYRVGEWRLLTHVSDRREVIVYVLKIGNRKDVYK